MARQRTAPRPDRHGRRLDHVDRELVGALALLAEEEDYHGMTRYGAPRFHDHTQYLDSVDTVLRSRRTGGRRTRVGLLDPEEYAAYCAGSGLDPGVPESRQRFTEHLVETGATLPYEGRPLADLLPDLAHLALRRATFAYAGELLDAAGRCEECGEILARAAFDRASELLTAACHALGAGRHHLVCSTSTQAGPLLAEFDIDTVPGTWPHPEESAALDLTTVLAAALAAGLPCGLVARTSGPDTSDAVRGWRLREHTLRPLTAAEVFDAYCTDTETGEPIPPEPGVDYRAAPVLTPPRTPSHDHGRDGEDAQE
ncbi:MULTISPECIES: hypothetical protein [unclassified Streptomyces]|uniref:hypothetical protein n=1 Tax=unclassified Streptomyces TaxID=2593676 RepID=UPI000BACEB54|nr:MULTISPECIES: hypothetical protein [unclassified Streptomyces]ASY35989.1 hypothetical protein CAC01_27615 [Streptomyces sp. CLI2509]MYX24751.1 hypothetical protein [Streptomyces sp. SID8380]